MTAEGSSHPHIVPITHMGDKDEMQMLFGKVRSVCSDCPGQTFTVKNSGTGLITLATSSSQTIDGSATKTLYRYDSITVASDGANWIVI